MTTTTKYAEIEQRIDRAISDLERIKQIARSLDEENAALRAAWSADVARLRRTVADMTALVAAARADEAQFWPPHGSTLLTNMAAIVDRAATTES